MFKLMRFSWKTARLLWCAEMFHLSSLRVQQGKFLVDSSLYCSWMSWQNTREAKQSIDVVNVHKENWMQNEICIWTAKVWATSVDLGKLPKHGDSRNRKVQEKHLSINGAELTSCCKWACPAVFCHNYLLSLVCPKQIDLSHRTAQ